MRLWKSWVIASRDFKTFTKRKNVLIPTVLFPLGIGVGLPLVLEIAMSNSNGEIPPSILSGLLEAFAFFFVVGAAVLPTAIASYSLVGDKVEKSLEPLLATPTSDGEILLGKSIAAFLLPYACILVGFSVFMAASDIITSSILTYLYFPNWEAAVLLLILAPLVILFDVMANVIISSRSTDVRAAQQLGGLLVFPFAALYVAAEIQVIKLSTVNLLLISGVLALIDLGLFYASTASFRREEILTKWK